MPRRLALLLTSLAGCLSQCVRPGGCVTGQLLERGISHQSGARVVRVRNLGNGQVSERLDLEVVRNLGDPSMQLISLATEKLSTRLVPNSAVCAAFPENYACFGSHVAARGPPVPQPRGLQQQWQQQQQQQYRSSCSRFVSRVDLGAPSVSVDPGIANSAVPGLVYSAARAFPTAKTGHHWADCTWLPVHVRPHDTSFKRVRHDHPLATALQECPCAVAHLLTEALPRFLLLADTLLPDVGGGNGSVHFLLPACPGFGAVRWLELLSPAQRARTVVEQWKPMEIHSAPAGDFLYLAGCFRIE